MTIARALSRGEELIRAAGGGTPRLDALVLLAADIQKDKVFLYSHGEDELSPQAEAAYEEMLSRRADGIPVSYILRRKEFYGLEFYVDERVLVPRPETETLVDAALGVLRREPDIDAVHDVCTGTGCIPISIAANAPRAGLDVSASDVSPAALEVFRMNCLAVLGKELPHRQADLLSARLPRGQEVFGMITANPPYIAARECARMMASGWPEPELALNGGEDGLEIVLRLIKEAPASLRKNGWLLMEASPEQADSIEDELAGLGWRDTFVLRDLADRKRVIAGRRP